MLSFQSSQKYSPITLIYNQYQIIQKSYLEFNQIAF